MKHISVMTRALLEWLQPKDGGVYIDGSFGGGGHARAVLEAADCVVLAIDQDPDAIARGASLVEDFPDRLILAHGRFSDLEDLIAAYGIRSVDGVSFDAGLSSYQLEDGARGFSYQREGQLDMRMNNQQGRTASDWVNDLSERDLVHIIGVYGEERIAKRIARAMVQARQKQPITSTKQLVEIILSVRPRHASDRIHPATRSFQALRILVNDELSQLTQGLNAAERVLHQGGRLVVISFHSLEDRIVKRFFKSRSAQTGAGVNRHQPMVSTPPASFELLTKSPKIADMAELKHNPRARSAKLRAALRTQHAPHPLERVNPLL